MLQSRGEAADAEFGSDGGGGDDADEFLLGVRGVLAESDGGDDGMLCAAGEPASKSR